MSAGQDVIALHHAGKGEAEIAEIVGLSRNNVRAILKAAGIARPAHHTRAAARGDNLVDPDRADTKLRRF